MIFLPLYEHRSIQYTVQTNWSLKSSLLGGYYVGGNYKFHNKSYEPWPLQCKIFHLI